MQLLHNTIRPYAWGSRTAIAQMQGRPVPAEHPEAELWMGAHPGDPSTVRTGDGRTHSLVELIADDPVGQLGEATASRWDGRLPFLLKVLAADEPLSMQAHPSAEQAAQGYAREEANGIARDAAVRNYPDPTAKPELLCALTEFDALAGFRDPQRTVKLLHAVQTPGLAPHVELLAAQPNQDGMRALFTTWITLPQMALDALLPELLDACVAHLRGGGEFVLECRTVLELGERYPGDAGVLAALLLNRLVLAPGEAIFLPAGNLHSYLSGTGVEILANSDNVLRGGLTSKHVDVAELLRVLDFSCGDMPVITGEPAPAGGLSVYRAPAPEFRLSGATWTGQERDGVSVPSGSPRIVLCTSGSLTLRCGATSLHVPSGGSAWLAARDPEVAIEPGGVGTVQVFVATVGSD